MRSFPARFLALAALVPALFLLAVVPGCAKQSEGERCGDDLGPLNDDCGDGLTCREIPSTDKNYRCCYSDGRINDSRCETPDAVTGTGGSGGSGGSGGATAGSSSQTDAGSDGGAD
jgi:uncharacterized membrane protein YgcG